MKCDLRGHWRHQFYQIDFFQIPVHLAINLSFWQGAAMMTLA
jgi:hypothetical protein